MNNNMGFARIIFSLLGSVGAIFASFSVNSAALPEMPDVAVKAIARSTVDNDRMVVLSRLLKSHVAQTRKIAGDLEGTDQLPEPTKKAAWLEKKTLISSKRIELKTLSKDTFDEIAAVRKRLLDSGLTQEAQTWVNKRTAVEKKFAELDSDLDAVERSSHGLHANHVKKLKAHAGRLQVEADAQDMPVGMPVQGDNKPKRRLPVSQPISKERPRYMADASTEAQRAFALLQAGHGNLAAPPTLPADASTCGNTPEDLAETLEVKFSPEIRALAEQLGYSPARIYKYVHDNIRFEPYYGSLKGSQATLVSQAGGATDQASLLIALLRASNVPSRYVKGSVVIRDFADRNDLKSWLGGVTTPEAAVALLGYGQNPTVYVTDLDGPHEGLAFVQVWVEACVPYANYRGTQDDHTGFKWIPLDPSVKIPKSVTPIDPPNVVFDYSGYMAGRLYQGRDLMPIERYEQQVEAAIKLLPPNYGNNTLSNLVLASNIDPLEMDVLPTSLPYEVASINEWDTGLTGETASLPPTHRYTVDLQLTSGLTTLLTANYPMPQIALQRVTLGYKGATPALETAINSWKTDGNMGNAVPCGLSVVPELKFDGVSQALGTSGVDYCSMGHQLKVQIWFPDNLWSQGGHYTYTNTFNSKAAELIALQTYAHQASDKWIEARSARLLNSVNTTPNPNSNEEETLGEYLNIAGLKYYRYLDDDGYRLAPLGGNVAVPIPGMGRTTSQVKVQYMFDVPFAVSRAGFVVDTVGGSMLISKVTGNIDWSANLLYLYQCSYRESYLWMDNAKVDAISTVRGLQFAAETGIQVLTLTSANWNANVGLLTSNVNTALNWPLAEISTIQNLVNSGGKVVMPRSLIQYGDWKGYVYMQENYVAYPPVGLTAAIGKINGGATVECGNHFSDKYNQMVTTLCNAWGYEISTYVPPVRLGSPGFIQPVAIGSIGNGASQVNTLPPCTGNVNMVTGNEYHSEIDFSIKSRGLPLEFKRSYNSRQPPSGWQVTPLGYGWSHNYNQYLTFKDQDFSDPLKGPIDTDGITSSIIWTEGSGSDRYIKVTGATAANLSSCTFSTPAGYYFTFAKLSNGIYTITEKNGTVYEFQSIPGSINQVARLTSIRDTNGNTQTLNYIGNNLISVGDGITTSRKLDFSYDGSNRISQIRDWSGRAFKYEYDASGNLSAVFNPLAIAGVQTPTRYTYYSGSIDHSLKSIILPRGNGMNFEYYANGKMFREYNSLGETNTFTFNEMRLESSFINKRGFTLRYFFNLYGAPVQVDDEIRGSTFITYDFTNPYLKLSEKNPLGFITAYSYDANFNITQITLPSTETIAYSNYNVFGSPGRIKDVRGNYTILKYDLRGNLLERIALRSGIGAAVTDTQNYAPLAADIVARTINTYDANGNVLTTKKVRDFATNAGPTLTYGYLDANNGVNGLNVTSITRTGDRDGNPATVETDVATLTYDTLGRLVTGIRDNWYDTYVQYDELDRVVTFKDDFGKLRSNSYDPNGNLIKTWLVNGTVADVTTLSYDLADRKESSVSNGGGVSSFQYDAAGNVIKISNPDQYSLGIDYDGANRPFRAYDQAGHDVVTYMDQMGKPLQIVDPNGNRVVREYYDASKEGRLKVSRDAMGRGITTDYDAAGNATSVTDHLGAVTRTSYDELNRPVRVVGPLLTASGNVRPLKTMTYNALGYVINIKMGQTDASGSNTASDTVAWQTNYTWDDYGHKLSETDGLNKTRTFAYDLYGNMTSATSP